jgi:hypothetical protein
MLFFNLLHILLFVVTVNLVVALIIFIQIVEFSSKITYRFNKVLYQNVPYYNNWPLPHSIRLYIDDDGWQARQKI